jgi:hypothetical protein
MEAQFFWYPKNKTTVVSTIYSYLSITSLKLDYLKNPKIERAVVLLKVIEVTTQNT